MKPPEHLPKRHGLSRLWHASGHSWRGLKTGWREPAFRQELLLSAVLVPLAVGLSEVWLEAVVLVGAVLLVLVVELLNTAIERTVDRIGSDWHALSGMAKDLASAAVLLSLVFCLGVWASAGWRWLSG
ncbi:MAG TPA: diacylglycerol kinase [Hydrogenophaga sp.]|uniref:diacylglycerol kinase n=1 Tax=Hydrogenophaga sp. TaxID=1904254 RepID=UPI002C3C15CF|nr:diacylglycerol kinase [Hydrogenophaga sp.]HMN94379.1 diacylglycerol kinase [Hydrogenophaga sp.]HMP10851.1 diacylglycerol kinase [Hydrogenophaga sp.]